MNEMLCPNCGRHLVNYRTDRQAAGRREVELRWTICVHCRHVALDSWTFAEGSVQSEYGGDGRAQEREYMPSRMQERA
jgi:hypothetical protein